ncbi:MAG: JmjC domain-containing protein [Burkholderiales bacterium]
MPDTASPPLPPGLSAGAFVARHWHKRALLMRGALPAFDDLFAWPQLRALAERDDVESRLVVRDGPRYTLARGPFRRASWRSLPKAGWTLLVQGTNLHDTRADRLLRRFDFLPFARLDDLMVSYATPGGGVGPHVDSYDVFLLQGMGRRRWRYGRQKDLALRAGLPLKILGRFTPRHDHVLARGDMLYLPPQVAHDGVALDTAMTYSIGFRAASATEIAQAFLDFLRDRIELSGRYADPDLRVTSTPARIDAAVQRRFAKILAAIRVERASVEEFIGSFLSEPKPDVFFSPPAPPLTRAAFARAIAARGVVLDRRTQLLYDARRFYVNGISLAAPAGARRDVAALADGRALAARRCAALGAATLALLHHWYCDGYLEPAA